MKCSSANIHKVLVVTLSNLGDVVLTLPVFKSLIAAFPQAEMHVVVSDRAKEVFENDARIKKVVVYDKKTSWIEKIHFLKQIRQERYDLIVDLRRSLIGLFGGAKFRNSYFYFTDRAMHRAQRHLSALRGLIALDSTADRQAACLPAGRDPLNPSARTVVVAVGSKSDIKKWPAEYYSKLLDRLILENSCQVILIGDKNDAHDAAKVKQTMNQPVMDLCGQTNFRELCTVLQQADLLITNDSAPLHIADSLGVSTLAIFGPTDPRKYGPRLGYSQAVSRRVFCAPCEQAQCRYNHECMKELGVGEVYQRAHQMLQDRFVAKNLRILVIRLDRIGDLILSLPAIHAIRERFPNASLSLMARSYTKDLVEGHPDIDEVIPYFYEREGRHRFFLGYFRLIHELIKRRFDIAFILHPSTRSHLLPFLAGIPYRIGFDSRSSFLLTKKVPDLRHEGKKHESEYTLDVVRAFGIETAVKWKAQIPVYQDESLEVLKRLEKLGWKKEHRFIALHPGASCPSKRWPKERFAKLAKRILSQLPHQVAVIGGADEKTEGQFLKREIGDGVLDLTGQLSLKELAAFLKRADLLVTNDSGPVHIASAVGTRTLCIFGRNQVGLSATRWRALGEGHCVIQKDVGCVVCLAHRCTIDFECLKAVEVEEVYCTLKQILTP